MALVKVPKVNLLPYRAERKRRLAIRFGSFCAASSVLGFILIGGVHAFYSMLQNDQNERNAIFDTEIAVLDRQISEIKKLKDDINATVARKNIVENLQANRARSVMLLNFLSNQPDGIYFKSVSTKGGSLRLEGVAQSNATVASYLKRMESVDILKDPKLIETTAASGKDVPQSSMNFVITAKIIDLASLKKDKDQKKKAGV